VSRVRRERLSPGGAERLAADLRPPAGGDLAALTAAVIADVRERGDAAVIEHVARFDAPDFAGPLRVPVEELAAARDAASPELRAAVLAAASQVRLVAEGLLGEDVALTLPYGQSIRVRTVPVGAAGCYVPGGRAAYPSSVVMAAVPAQAAGVGRVVIVTPPGPDGRPHPSAAAAASLLEIDEVYVAGGAAAIAALAHGTESIRPVDVVTGPGSAWVQEAKRQVSGTVGIEGIAGPSEVLVVADAIADPEAVALDLLAQAEHGPDSVAVLASPDAPLLDAVASRVGAEEPLGRVVLVQCSALADAVALSEAMAPEHLELLVEDPHPIAAEIRTAGAVFVGPNGATAFGDYVAGSNHVLPTGGAARFASALGPATYTRRMAVVEMSDRAVAELTPHLAALADAEGFPWHRRSAERRAERGGGS